MRNKEEDEGVELFIDESDKMEGKPPKKSFRTLNPKPNSRSVSEYFNDHKALVIKKVVRFRSRKVTAPIKKNLKKMRTPRLKLESNQYGIIQLKEGRFTCCRCAKIFINQS
jgi:hypothetical protein